MDICLQNDLEPTKELCEMFMNTDYPSIRQKYWDMKKGSHKNEETTPAVAKVETVYAQPNGNEVVYLSELLKERFPESFNRLTSILEKNRVKFCLLKGTKDIWCRDYMPVQTKSGKLVQFRYEPSYLKGLEWDSVRSDVHEVCKTNGIKPIFSDINLDGGNVLICEGRAIISDRVFSENGIIKGGPNEDAEKNALIRKLSKLLECEIIIIPSEKSDMTGHADGMVRFVDRNTILGNNLAAEYKYWREGMQKVIEKYDLKYIDMPFFDPKDHKHPISAVGIYLNYLEVNDLIVVPTFGREEDKLAINILRQAFPNKQIEEINFYDVAQEGGSVNCTTWVVRNKPTH